MDRCRANEFFCEQFMRHVLPLKIAIFGRENGSIRPGKRALFDITSFRVQTSVAHEELSQILITTIHDIFSDTATQDALPFNNNVLHMQFSVSNQGSRSSVGRPLKLAAQKYVDRITPNSISPKKLLEHIYLDFIQHQLKMFSMRDFYRAHLDHIQQILLQFFFSEYSFCF